MHNVHPEVFRLYNDVNTKHKDKKTIHELLYWQKKLPKEYEIILEKIIKQFNDINDALKPVMDMGITFDLFLVGGSVRDLVTGNGNLIKDLDIMLSFHQPVTPKVPKAKFFMKKTKMNFEKPEIQSVIYRDGATIPFAHWDILNKKPKKQDYQFYQQQERVTKTAFFDIIACSLAQKLNLNEVYKPSLTPLSNEPLTEKYVDGRLNGVIKLNKEGWDWPVDILITENGIDSFLSAFDFGICKIGMELLCGRDIREQREILPQTPTNLMKRVKITTHFLKDASEKNLSMTVSQMMTMRQVQHSCENHLERLEKKYPWPVKIDIEQSSFNPHLSKETKIDPREEYLKAFFLKRKLDRTLEVKTETKKVIKKI